MKKLLGLSLALFCFVSCSGDDDNTPAEPTVNLTQITKRWYNVSYIVSGTTVPYEGNPAAACGKDFTEFVAGGALRKSDITDCQTEAVVTTGTYTATQTAGVATVVTAIGGNTTSYKVVKLNANELQLERVNSNPLTVEVYTSNP
jgi:hypothetical protein